LSKFAEFFCRSPTTTTFLLQGFQEIPPNEGRAKEDSQFRSSREAGGHPDPSGISSFVP